MIETNHLPLSNTKEARKRRNRAQRKLDKSNYAVIFLKRPADFYSHLQWRSGLQQDEQLGLWEQKAYEEYDDLILSMYETLQKEGYTRFYGCRKYDFVTPDKNMTVQETVYSHKLWGKTVHGVIRTFGSVNCGPEGMHVLVLFDPDHRDLDTLGW